MRLCASGTSLGAFRMLRASQCLKVLLPEIDAFIGERDDPAAHDRADTYWRLLGALDADVHAGNEPSRPLCLAVLWLRVIEAHAGADTRTRPGSMPGSTKDLFDVVSTVLEPLVQDSRLPRRTFIIARRIIAEQHRFEELPGDDVRAQLFTLTEHFPEALNLFRLRSAAWGQGWERYEAWRLAYEEMQSASDDDVAALRKRGRRRRTRPRGRRRGSDS